MIPIICLAASIVAESSVAPKEGRRSDLQCGAYSLTIALEALDMPDVTFERIQRQLGPPSEHGYSMAQLSDCAQKFGCFTKNLDISLARLADLPGHFACIALVKKEGEYHYVNLYDLNRTTAQIIDFPHSYAVNRPVFGSMWTGKAMLISTQPISGPADRLWIAVPVATGLVVVAGILFVLRRRVVGRLAGAAKVLCVVAIPLGAAAIIAGCSHKGVAQAGKQAGAPSIEVRPDTVSFGTTAPSGDHTLKAAVRLFNHGSSDLVIHDIRSSCYCTVAKVKQGVVKRGASIELPFTIAPGMARGLRRTLIRIVSNDGRNPVAIVPIEWTVVPPMWTEPAFVDFGIVTRSSTHNADVEVGAGVPNRLKEIRINTLTPSITVGRRGVQVESEDGVFSERVSLTLTIAEDEALGEHSGLVSISGGEADGIRLPLRWYVSPDVYVSPSAVFLGNVRRGAKCAADLMIVHADESFSATAVESVRGPSGPMTFESDFKHPSSKIERLHLSFRSPSAPGYAKLVFELSTFAGRVKMHQNIECSMNIE